MSTAGPMGIQAGRNMYHKKIALGSAAILAAAAATLVLSAHQGSPEVRASAMQNAGSALLVLNKAESTLAIIDPTTLQVLGRVPTGEAPHEVIASADGRLAFVSNYGAGKPGNTISVIDIAAKKELRRVDLGPLLRPHGITESGGKIYFTIEGSRAVARYDPSENRIDWLMGTGQTGTHMVVVAPDRGKLYTANTVSGNVTMIRLTDAQGAAPIVQIEAGKGAEGIDISPDGHWLWVAHRGDGGLSIIDTSTDKVVETLKAGQQPIRVKFTPDGKQVLVSDAFGGDLIIFDAAARKETRRIRIGSTPVGILIAPDGQRAFVAQGGANKVAVVNLETFAIDKSIDPGKGPDGMAWAGR
jgi:YVTN family beta-propeller protein